MSLNNFLLRLFSRDHENGEENAKKLSRKINQKEKDELRIDWNSKALKEILRSKLAGEEVLIVSNREPYIHVKRENNIDIQYPVSGLVTALEPIMRACSGTWVAHGSGSADKEVVDPNSRIVVPPDNPSYTLRRVWLTELEEKGYYDGFSNEGLWPLCHMAHVRPIFRSEDWLQYQKVNAKFAQAIFEEIKTDDPVILVQDYHLALLPRFIKKKLPRSTVITFWHVPWPNPEAFGICPWLEHILDGLLGSSILGFQTRFHCNNFIDTVDRYLESRIERETSTISYGGKLTSVNSYPISIEWPPAWLKNMPSIEECRVKISLKYGIDFNCKIGIGIDRLDYTKGILEKFQTIDRFLDKNPQWIERFVFVQIAAPSRSKIKAYQEFEVQARRLAEQINNKYSRNNYKPILLLIDHFDPPQIYEFYRASQLCFVSSLHDGMNLVAKEFAAAHTDERGVLILSQFTGASRELPHALVVNPYDIDQCASAIQSALEMPELEERDRMRSMRFIIEEYNVYRWAGRMLLDAARIRQKIRFMGKFGTTLDTSLNV